MKNTRTTNSIKNSILSIISNFTSIIMTFITQTFFIKLLGTEYLGLNGLFSNILSMLSLFELGIGDAIVFCMYKPIAENNKEKIKSLINFYKKAYNIIICIVGMAGLSIVPLLKYIVGDISIDINIQIVYILFLLSTITSYVMVYKRNMLYANQKSYIIKITHCIYLLLLNIVQILVLILTRYYYLYLVIKIVFQILENITLNFICNKKYPYILEKSVELDKKTEIVIFNKVKALIFHRIGGIVVTGTDNIIISKFIGVAAIGLYSNYFMIVSSVQNLFSQAISSLTASVGNLVVENDKRKMFSIFKKIRFINFWISTFTSICLLLMVQPFICIWVGEKYLLSFSTVLVIIFNYFQSMQRQTYITFKDSAGIWVEDKFVPLIESSLNIIFSLLCLKIFGLTGVFIGTAISGLALWCYSYPKFVYKKLFNRSYIDYAKETIGYILLFIVLAFGTYFISTLLIFDNIWLQLISNTLIALTIPNIVLILIFRKTDNFKYFFELFKKILHKIISKFK